MIEKSQAPGKDFVDDPPGNNRFSKKGFRLGKRKRAKKGKKEKSVLTRGGGISKEGPSWEKDRE